MKKYLKKAYCLPSIAAIALLTTTSSAFAASGTWDANTAGNWSDITKWNAGTGPVADGATFTATFDAALSADRIITLDGARTIGHLSFLDNNGGSQRFTISGANTLTLDANGSGGTSIIGVGAGTSATIGGGNLVLAGSGNMEKTGSGSLNLNTSNSGGTFTGSILVSDGGLVLSGTTTAQTALSGVALTLGGGSNNVTFTVGAPSDGATYSTGGITVAAGGSGSVTFGYNSGTRSIISGSVALNKSATVNSASSGALSFSGIISGGGGILKTGTGMLELRNVNTYGGGTTVSKGGIRLAHSSGLGLGTLTLGDADTGSSNISLLLVNGTSAVTNVIHVTNNGTGTVTINTAANENTGSHKTLSGGILLDRSAVIAANGTSTANVIVSGVISGVGGVSTSSASATRVVFTNANTYGGGTTIANGTLRTANTSALGTGQVAFDAANTVTLDLNNTALGVQSLSGGGSAAAVLTGGSGGVLTINGGNVTAASFAGVISGTGGLVKNGAGVQILTGENTFSGSTVVNNGVLQLGSGSAVGLANTSGVTLAGGTLVNGAGNSALGTGVVSMSSGAITPGGIGTAGSFTVAAGQAFSVTGGTLNVDLLSAGSFDRILGSGSGTFSLVDTTLSLSGLTSVGGSYQVFDGFGGSNVVSNLTISGVGVGFTASLDGTGLLTIVSSTIPEPSTYAALVGSALLGFVALRRRR